MILIFAFIALDALGRGGRFVAVQENAGRGAQTPTGPCFTAEHGVTMHGSDSQAVFSLGRSWPIRLAFPEILRAGDSLRDCSTGQIAREGL